MIYLVFRPKRRKAVLVGDIARDGDALIRRKCERRGWDVLALEAMPDHVHLFARVWPADAAAEVDKEVKGIASHEFRLRYPSLLKMPSLRTRSYFAATAGNVSRETIGRYIEARKGV